jgi:hypothetical protein
VEIICAGGSFSFFVSPSPTLPFPAYESGFTRSFSRHHLTCLLLPRLDESPDFSPPAPRRSYGNTPILGLIIIGNCDMGLHTI